VGLRVVDVWLWTYGSGSMFLATYGSLYGIGVWAWHTHTGGAGRDRGDFVWTWCGESRLVDRFRCIVLID